MRLGILSALAAVGLLLVTGCGGGDSGPSPSEYAKQADKVCRTHQARLGPLGRARTPREVADFVSRTLPVLRADIAGLRALRAPKGERALVAKWLARGDRAIAALTDLGRAARRGDVLSIQEIVPAAQENADRAEALAHELGLKECSI